MFHYSLQMSWFTCISVSVQPFSVQIVVCFRSDRRSRVISPPSNFSHIAHIGPDQGYQVLIDLPKVSYHWDILKRDILKSAKTDSCVWSRRCFLSVWSSPFLFLIFFVIFSSFLLFILLFPCFSSSAYYGFNCKKKQVKEIILPQYKNTISLTFYIFIVPLRSPN